MNKMLFSIVLLFVFFALYLFVGRRKDPKLPPGIHGWPIVGYLPSTEVPMTDQIEAHRKKFGDIFLWRIGLRNVVFLCHPNVIKKAFNNPLLIDRPDPFFTFDSWTNFKKTGIVNGNGLHWQMHRRFFLRNLKDSGFGKSAVEPIIHEEAECLIKEFKENYLNTTTEVPDLVSVAALNVVWKLESGIRFDSKDKFLQSFLTDLTHMTKYTTGLMNLFDIFPWLQHFTPSVIVNNVLFPELQMLRKRIRMYLKGVVEKRRQHLDVSNPRGLIDHYLLEMKNDTNIEFSEHLLTSLGDLFFAGTDTTATTLRWMLHFMACYPEIQRKIQVEIDTVVPRERLPSLGDKSCLPYTEACTFDILRITSLIPMGIVHAASEDTTIAQYVIPKGTIVTPFLYGCHMNPKFWEKPSEFYPEHFLDAKGNFTAKNEAFLPFSTGRRSCLGESLGRSELFLFTAALLQQFTFSLAEGEVKDAGRDPTRFIFAHPKPLKIVITERKFIN